MDPEIFDSEISSDEEVIDDDDESDDCPSVVIKLERVDQEFKNCNNQIAEKSSEKVETRSKSAECSASKIGSVEQTSKKGSRITDDELSEVFEFLIGFLRNYPEQRMEQMTGGTIYKIWTLGKEQNLFQRFSDKSLDSVIRNHILKEKRLEDLVGNEEDRQLILTNLHKLGIGTRNPKTTNEDTRLVLDKLPKFDTGVMARRRRFYDDDQLSKIFQFLIGFLRHYPERQMEQMSGPIIDKIWALGRKRRLFQNLSAKALDSIIRRILKENRLEEIVDNAEDRQLILANLHKLGYGTGPGKKRIRDDNLAEICQFLIRLLRNFPEQKIKKMSGPVTHRIYELGRKERLFKSFTKSAFDNVVRRCILKENRLSYLVDNEEDRQLILSNLLKLGIGAQKYRRSKKNVRPIHEDTRLVLDKLPKFDIGVMARRRRFYDDDELREVCQFLFRLLRDWPEQKFERMTGQILFKIWKLGTQEGLFQRFSGITFNATVRNLVSGNRLCRYIDNKKDRRLILSNLSKLGIGVRSERNKMYKTAKKSSKSESRDISSQAEDPSMPENHSRKRKIDSKDFSDSKIDLGHLKSFVAPEKIHTFSPKKVNLNKKISTIKNELKKMKKILSLERQEKMSNFKQIEEFSKQIDYHQQEMIKSQNLAYQQHSRITELEHALVHLNCELSNYRKMSTETSVTVICI